MENQKVRVVKVWRDSFAEHIYLLQKLYYRGVLKNYKWDGSPTDRTIWVNQALYTTDKSKANKWAEHYGVKIQLVEDDEA